MATYVIGQFVFGSVSADLVTADCTPRVRTPTPVVRDDVACRIRACDGISAILSLLRGPCAHAPYYSGPTAAVSSARCDDSHSSESKEVHGRGPDEPAT